MSQLHQFISTLNEQELSRVKGMRLIGKESELFKYTLAYLQKDVPEVREICKDTGVTPSHLYKI
ncbi:MAG: hypothetical protein ACJ76F_09945, partial [Bacteroidia bacterium]